MSKDNLTSSEAREIERIKKMELQQDNKSLSDEIDEGLEILSAIADFYCRSFNAYSI